MADVFLSYRNTVERRNIVLRLAAILRAHDIEAWFDFGLEAGESFREQILNKLHSAKLVIPLWCAQSIESEWVLNEARLGQEKLLPARLQNVLPPKEFEAIQAADLIGWDGHVDDMRLQRFMTAICRRLGKTPRHRDDFLMLELQGLPRIPPLPDLDGPRYNGEPFDADELIAAAHRNLLADRNDPTRQKMRDFCEELRSRNWTNIPARYRYHQTVHDAYGRCTVVFSDEDAWRPGICLGFYHNTNDHRVTFVNPDQGIDLYIRIQASPETNPAPSRVMGLLQERVPRLTKLGARVLLKGQAGNGNPHTLCIVQKNLLQVLDGRRDATEQIQAVHAELAKWCVAIFEENTELVEAFGRLRGYPQ